MKCEEGLLQAEVMQQCLIVDKLKQLNTTKAYQMGLCYSGVSEQMK